jgi:hypothetical protein
MTWSRTDEQVRTDANGIMLRPITTDVFVRRRAVELFEASSGRKLTHTDREDLVVCIDADDGFEIAKALEHRGWCDVDAYLVDELDQGFIREALDELTEQWVRALGVKLSFSCGDAVRYRGIARTIVKVFPDHARYGLNAPGHDSNTYTVVSAEDVSALEPMEVEQ